jgi:transcriptional regulator with XRE-family HTH domain
VRRAKLIEARKAVGKTQAQVAEEVGVDRTTVGAWERGEATPHPGQRGSYAGTLNVTLSELAAMLSSMPVDAGEIPDWLAQFLAMEQSAETIRKHESEVIEGMLQTPGYVEAIVRQVGLHGVTDDYVRQNVRQRQQRQKRLRDGGLSLDVIQGEQVLHVRLGDAAVMAEQLHAMADMAEQPNVDVRILTFDAGQHEIRRLDSFCIFTHPWGTPTLCLEGYGGARFMTEADEVSYFTEVFDAACRVALSPTDSIAYIRDIAHRWETRR